MTQFRQQVKLEKGSVEVLAGWDEPLRRFYLIVEDELYEESGGLESAHPETNTEGYVYTNLDDDELNRNISLAQTFDYFENKLKELGIPVPAEFIAKVKDV